jgi:hypothetical protein
MYVCQEGWLLSFSVPLRRMPLFAANWFDTDPTGADIFPGTKIVQVQILKGFCRDYILGRKVTLAKKFEI